MAEYPMKDVFRAVSWKQWLDGVGVLPAIPLAYLIVNATRLSANAVTLLGLAAGLAGAALAWRGAWLWAASAYFAFFMLDTCDGAVARLRRQASAVGGQLDLRADRIVLIAAILAHIVHFSARGMAVETRLLVVFAMQFYLLDVFWMYQPAARPAPAAELVEEVEAPGRRTRLQTLSLYEKRLRVSPWLCEIMVFCAAAIMPSQRRIWYAVAIVAMAWDFAMDQLARPLWRRLRGLAKKP